MNISKLVCLIAFAILAMTTGAYCDENASIQESTDSDDNPVVTDSAMIHEKVQLTDEQADGYVIPLGPANLVFVISNSGMVGCGAFDVAALDNFAYPAARVRPTISTSISTIEDLLVGEVKDANEAAFELGVMINMTGREALDLM